MKTERSPYKRVRMTITVVELVDVPAVTNLQDLELGRVNEIVSSLEEIQSQWSTVEVDAVEVL